MKKKAHFHSIESSPEQSCHNLNLATQNSKTLTKEDRALMEEHLEHQLLLEEIEQQEKLKKLSIEEQEFIN